MSERKVSAYLLAREPEISKLEDSVQRYVQEGWAPIGGLCFTPENKGEYLQALIKRKGDE